MPGYADAVCLARDEVRRDRNETTSRNKVIERLTATDVDRWMREGAMLTDGEAYGQVLAGTPSR